MAKARMDIEKSAWRRHAVIALGIYEPNRNQKYKRTPYTTADFDPYENPAPARGIKLTKQSIAELKPMFER